MIPDQFNPNGDLTDIRLPIPHAETRMVGLIFLIHDPIRPSVSGYHIIGVPAGRSPTVS